jgi:hypothetical protein
VQSVRVAGRVAGYSITRCGVDTGSTTVQVTRLSDGRTLSSHDATTRQGVEGHSSVDSLVLRADGAVAWIATARSIGSPKFVREVARADRGGFTVLDSGPGVAPRSLRLHRSTLTWRDGSGRRRATLS